ncbi:MAG: OmpA family protein, partial [Geminicoccaceae bacterium]
MQARSFSDRSSTEPTYIGQKKIEDVIDGLKEANATQLRIVGFTDRTGSEATNKAIAEERA